MATYNVTNGHPLVQWDYDLSKNPSVDRIEVGIFLDQALTQLVSSSRVGSNYKQCTMACSDGFFFVSVRAVISSKNITSDWGAPVAMIVSSANPAPNPTPTPTPNPTGKPDAPTNIRVSQ